MHQLSIKNMFASFVYYTVKCMCICDVISKALQWDINGLENISLDLLQVGCLKMCNY